MSRISKLFGEMAAESLLMQLATDPEVLDVPTLRERKFGFAVVQVAERD